MRSGGGRWPRTAGWRICNGGWAHGVGCLGAAGAHAAVGGRTGWGWGCIRCGWGEGALGLLRSQRSLLGVSLPSCHIPALPPPRRRPPPCPPPPSRLERDSAYFSEKEMRDRQPGLWQHFIGQFQQPVLPDGGWGGVA